MGTQRRLRHAHRRLDAGRRDAGHDPPRSEVLDLRSGHPGHAYPGRADGNNGGPNVDEGPNANGGAADGLDGDNARPDNDHGDNHDNNNDNHNQDGINDGDNNNDDNNHNPNGDQDDHFGNLPPRPPNVRIQRWLTMGYRETLGELMT